MTKKTMWKVWFDHPYTDSHIVYTYVFADSEKEVLQKAHSLDMRYEFAELVEKNNFKE